MGKLRHRGLCDLPEITQLVTAEVGVGASRPAPGRARGPCHHVPLPQESSVSYVYTLRARAMSQRNCQCASELPSSQNTG